LHPSDVQILDVQMCRYYSGCADFSYANFKCVYFKYKGHLHIRTSEICTSIQLPGPCPAGGAHQLAVPFGLIIIVGYQYGMYHTWYPEAQG